MYRFLIFALVAFSMVASGFDASASVYVYYYKSDGTEFSHSSAIAPGDDVAGRFRVRRSTMFSCTQPASRKMSVASQSPA